MMWPRKRIDITWKDLFAASWACAIRRDPKAGRNLPVDCWSNSPRAVPTLSVRSGLHLLLGAVNWPMGSEVLMSAMTIPAMARIVRHHGYVPVPVDIDIDTAAPTLDALERATTTSTRGLIVAHLFGSRIPLKDILSFANSREIDVLEDCAQAFVGPTWSGTDGCLASLFSFGTIKTSTACGGGVLVLRNQQLSANIEATQDSWPVLKRSTLTRRILTALLLKSLAYRLPFSVFRLAWFALRRDLDTTLNNSVRGFRGEQLINQISQAPSEPLTALVSRRLQEFDNRQLSRRTSLGNRLVDRTQDHATLVGHKAKNHTFWVFPVASHEPNRLITRLRQSGFDATQGGSMEIVAMPDDRDDTATGIRRTLPKIVYLPLYPDMPEAAIDRMARVVCDVESTGP